VVVQVGAAHFGALDVLPDILRWVSSGRADDRTLVANANWADGPA
jgi:hypothetical protein